MEQNENNNNENQNEEQENKEKEQTNDDSEKEKNDEISKDFEILSSDSAQYDYNYKIIIIGDSGVGKTCLTYRATSGEFREKMAATIGFEYFPFVVKYKNKILKLEIWDTCGQEAYRSLIKSFFNNSSLAIIVYAVDNKKSFSSIDEWIRQCRSLCSPDTRFFLIGNKNDVEEEK
jgi:small GTP-binding protein